MGTSRIFQLIFFSIIFIIGSQSLVSAQVYINEFSASNLNSFPDNYGKTEDWVELYNDSVNEINISGFHLSDKETKPMKWSFPAGTTIPGKGFLVVYCSGRDSLVFNQYHSNFKLAQTSGKDIILLSDPTGNILESHALDITLVEHSWCRSSDGLDDWKICTEPTHGSSNNEVAKYSSYTHAPSIDLEAGYYSGVQQVSITNNDPNGTLRYTLNGANPSEFSAEYTGPVMIDKTTVVKAQSFSNDPNILTGKMVFNTYLIDEDYSLAVFSVAAADVIDLANGNGDLIPIGSIEYFNTDKEREAISFGSLNRHGQDSWALDHRSLDWISRDEMGYSKAVDAELFSYSDRDEYQKFMFRNSGDDNYPAIDDENHEGSTHLRDEYVHTLSQNAGLELDVRAVERVILFLNGEYWGVYGMRERPVDHDYTDYYYDQGKYEVQYLSTWGWTEIEYGGGKAQNDWVALRNFILTNDMGIPENYAVAEDSINMVSLIDYMLVNLNVVASDWLNYNTGWWRGLNPDGDHKKWGYILWDLDASFDYYINYSGVPNISPDAMPCDLEDIGEYMDLFFSNPNFELSEPGEIENPADCNSIINGSSPYPANDPIFLAAVEAYTPCCNDWDFLCDFVYDEISANEGVALDPVGLNDNFDVGQHEKIFFKLLQENESFKELYYGRYADLMNSAFTCENMIQVLDSMVTTIQPEMPRQIERWGGTMVEWESNVVRLKNFINARCELLDEGALDCYPELSGPHEITLMVEPNIGVAEIDISELDIEEFPWVGEYFGGTQTEIKARVFDEYELLYEFSHWTSNAGNEISPSSLDRRAYISMAASDTLTAVFNMIGIDMDGDGFPEGVDCDDANPNINPDAEEICDNLDNNCNGLIDEELGVPYYQDADGDGFGNPNISLLSCTGQAGYTLNNTDCDDADANVNPGSIEICDNLDNNCNGAVDEGLSNTYYADSDGDGFGDPNVSMESCTGIVGFTLNNTDCDDTNPEINEAAIEIPNNEIDENCDGILEVTGEDLDGDGYFSDVDCDDNNPEINPGAEEDCDGIDNNCDGAIDEGLTITMFEDADEDGYGNSNASMQSCGLLAGFSLNNTDCDDANAGINPESVEICDGFDNNCDGQIDEGFTQVTYYTDEDGDGFGTDEAIISCIEPLLAATQSGDCDDSNPSIYPGSFEIANNEIDEDCDGEALVIDNDGDGFNSDIDCDDDDASINPEAEELNGNGIDENCDGLDGGTATHEIDGLKLTIFPNPAIDKLNIVTSNTKLNYEMYKLGGELVMKGKLGNDIILKELPSGMYLLKIISGDGADYFVHKVVKM